MTTTLRPSGPERRTDDGGRARSYEVCVNGRPVGAIELGTHPVWGAAVGRLAGLRIDEPDRHRGRATVAVLAADEVLRGWGCRRVEIQVPAVAAEALSLATALGYTERNRNMARELPARAPDLPAGSTGRPMTEAEYAAWLAHEKEAYARTWMERGVPEAEAYAKSEADHARSLPAGLASPDVFMRVLEHEGTLVGSVWVSLRRDAERTGLQAYVYDVVVGEAYRGRGHGRALMLVADATALTAGATWIGLNVFADNTPALRLYESLGYRPVEHSLFKQL